MSYKKLENVARGVEQQLLACTKALELHEDLPQEGTDLLSMIEEASKLCDEIVVKAAEEPDEA